MYNNEENVDTSLPEGAKTSLTNEELDELAETHFILTLCIILRQSKVIQENIFIQKMLLTHYYSQYMQLWLQEKL